MTISFAEVRQTLLSGKPLTWSAFEGHASGSLRLVSPAQRRLFSFLLSQDRASVASGDESLFDELVSTWNKDDIDPASIEITKDQDAPKDVWRLDRIEASGFGGLTLCGGPPFDLQVAGQNWCLNGQNGSGKTSIASAILWGLTGQRIREQDGPTEERGERSPVISGSGQKIGSWPSFASYPARAEHLSNTVEVWVRLTFINQNGEAATAFRRMICPPEGDSTVEATVDPRLESGPQLLETGLLMPARLARIGFGDKSGSLYEAVKMLTGLDQFSDIAEGCGHFTHRGKRFLKYGKDHGLDRWSEKFSDEMSKASEKAKELRITLPDERQLSSTTLVADLKHAGQSASDHAATHLRALASDITDNIDTTTAEGRETVRNAVAAARTIANQGTKGIPLFEAWTALKEAKDDEKWNALPGAIGASRVKLEGAIKWHAMQLADEKFRLKALAARYFVPPHEHLDTARCPLCEGLLSSGEQQELAAQMNELRKDAEEAERRLDDVCLGLESDLEEHLSEGLRKHRILLNSMDPKKSYGVVARERFCDQFPFSDVLLDLSKHSQAKIDEQEATLPAFVFSEFEEGDDDEPEHVVRLRRSLHSLDRLWSLVVWWSEHREAFRAAWAELIGRTLEDDQYPSNSVVGRIQVLEQALSKAASAEELSRSLLAAASAAENSKKIHEVQALREEIAEAIKPLKDLRLLVATETARSIDALSDRIKEILDRIHLRERLVYEKTSLGRRVIHVGGSFAPGMQIDAALVANSSWLRAILWAFIFALREQTIEGLGANTFPLTVLDDPQTSFDPRNKRKWAEELARLANMSPSSKEELQLFLTTHERQFYQCMVDVERLSCEQGLIGGVNSTAGVVTVVNAGWLQKAWREANDNNDDSRARDYISDVRMYCEDLLKFMLRGEDPDISDLSLDGLRRGLKSLHDTHVPPFDRKAFSDLLKTLGGRGWEADEVNK